MGSRHMMMVHWCKKTCSPNGQSVMMLIQTIPEGTEVCSTGGLCSVQGYGVMAETKQSGHLI